ncbi:MAG: prepilin-type N-terminal cleavage/methylation domain-containing protein [bacterium]|nr:prepilin-type N-terminal cleavage/methylation domain-containing protein [bacterium]
MNKNKGFGLIEMLAAVLIVMLLVFLYVKLVWKNGGVSQQTKKALSENGIKADNSNDMVQHAQETVDQLNKKSDKMQKQYEENE